MKGSNQFTREEADQIVVLIRQKLRASRTEQKKIRNKIRRLGFYFSDFSDKKGYDTADFKNLIDSGVVKVTEVTEQTQSSIPDIVTSVKNQSERCTDGLCGLQDIEDALILNASFTLAKNIDDEVPDCTGFYCICLALGSELPSAYQSVLALRDNRLIYIGKAEGQSLRRRFLNQELRANGHGTFFRSIGAVLGYRPPKGSLRLDQKNYRFADDDIARIIDWINENLEVTWIKYSGPFFTEEAIIEKYKPLLNIKHNPSRLNLLSNDRDECLRTARSLL